MAGRRPLHFVFKVGNRNATTKFYRQILGMKILRHEEFEEGCEASCNGPYDGKWSKTMVGYGDEDDHFVVELTYNYGIKKYELGNDYQYIDIYSKAALRNAKEHGWPMTELANGAQAVQTDDGYTFRLHDQDVSGDPVKTVALGVSDVGKSVDYWHKLLGMQLYEKTDTTATLGYSDVQCKLHLIQLNKKVEHASAFGRIAFSCPSKQLKDIQNEMKEKKQTILKDLVSLPTPGKATVQVVILADPDGHEICFVGDEAFRELSKTDSTADRLLNEAMEKDGSDEWFAKKKAKAESKK